jgi:hypothetical protein
MRPLVVLAGSEMPTELLGSPELTRRQYARAGIVEFRFELRDRRPKVPIRRFGTVQLARWGNSLGRSRALPRVAFARKETVETGGWARYGAIPVDIAATFWCHGGAWVFVREGIRGILVPDELGWAVCFPVCETASNYYKNMTGGQWMPVLIRQRY